ncbi:MAG: heavy metal translocating P-type ATPase metal-binding domain-containing protein [Sediminibacterium sp.]
MALSSVKHSVQCFHCGEDCDSDAVYAYEKGFCCVGCKMVYEILNETGLCDYYAMAHNPGINRKQAIRPDKFAFLDEDRIIRHLITFREGVQTHVTFYFPQIHCSSCLWLLENLHRLEPSIVSSKVNFEKKEADIIFDHSKISLRKVAELTTSIGYEPYISFQNMDKPKVSVSKSKIYKLGVAGFCFANIMLLSFPEYLGIDHKELDLLHVFRYISLLLSLPVFFYAASEFYLSAWKSIQHGFLNIDAPIVLSILITFGRSLYEIFTGTGAGYLDSMSGIVFFMMAGRVLQDKTYSALSFERDYTSYFPVAVTKIESGKESFVTLDEIKLNDTLLIHNQELIPADGILTCGSALIDYSFVNGESFPVTKEMGEIVYAGGKHLSSNIEVLVIKEVAQSYLTKLWNRQDLKADNVNEKHSFVHILSRYFTWIVFSIAIITAIYWYAINPAKVWNAVTSILIIACPCGLLLSNTFANGNILRRLARNNFYLRNAQTIENIAAVNHIVFDKTGTLTTGRFDNIEYEGIKLSTSLRNEVAVLAKQSTHPLCRAIAKWANIESRNRIAAYTEMPGEGIEGIVNEDLIALGSAKYLTGESLAEKESCVYLAIEGKMMGRFVFRNQYREQIPLLIKALKKSNEIAVLSGDNDGEKATLEKLISKDAMILFNQGPKDKLESVKKMQGHKRIVMMIGDGLNDAGALKQADVGVSVVEENNNFSPASDAILQAKMLPKLDQFIQLCRFNKKVVLIAFVVSALYNIIGLYFAVNGGLQPLIAAILMPCSSISIVVITFGLSNLKARMLKI